MSQPVFVPLPGYREYSEGDMARRAADFYKDLARRRTVREFSNRPVPRSVIEDCVRAVSIRESLRKMKDSTKKYFFLKKYNHNEYYLFLEK